MPELDGTIGSATANSVFETLAEAEELGGELLYPGVWGTTATDDQKKSAIIFMSRLISSGVPWEGARTYVGQSLAFPRTGLTRDNGATEVDSATIPIEIKFAVLVGARLYASTDTTNPTDIGNILPRLLGLKADTVELKFAEGEKASTVVGLNLPAQVLQWIPREWIREKEEAAQEIAVWAF
jgi:hypothetical protein